MEKKLRLLVHTKAAPEWNMAADEALFLSSQKKESLPVLRVYTWKKRCVTFGCGLSYEKVRGHLSSMLPPGSRVPLVRRPTGGGVVLHEDDLTFLLCGNARSFFNAGDVLSSYAQIHQAVMTGFSMLSLFSQSLALNESEDVRANANKHEDGKMCFHEPVKHDVMMGNKKLAGGAQRRSGNYFLHQGTVQGVAAVLDFSDALSALCGGFRTVFGAAFQISALSAEEKSRIRFLEETKYGAKSWNINGKMKEADRNDSMRESSGKIKMRKQRVKNDG